jgi:uncharacterized membrane protein
MLQRLRFVLRGIAYDLRKGLLARPGFITLGYVLLAVGMVTAERRYPALTELASRIARVTHEDVGASQLILATIAGSMMTTIAVVLSVLIMALSLASLQFSPRVLRGFMGDRPTQNTLGIFMGTFVYCLLVLRTVQGEPRPFVPAASVAVAMTLAASALAWLVYFIHHIGQGIHANHLVDRIARETIVIIDEEFPIEVGRADTHPEETGPPPPTPAGAAPVEARDSGYVQLVNRERLLQLAREHELVIYQEHGIGEFAVRGNPLLSLTPPERLTPQLADECALCFDLGELRTMQQDVHFGIRQIVDMGLKAISPAINDPSTACTCIDHLAAILCHLARRRILPVEMRDEASGKLLMVRRAVTFQGSIDLAFNQLRQYSRSDMAVALRMLRALTEVALATDHPPHQDRALHHAELVVAGLTGGFLDADKVELDARLRALRERILATRTSHAEG